jgi:hypothetical protein
VLAAAVGAGLLLAAAAWLLRVRHGVRREAGLSVLLITIDTLRADALGAYGNRDAATPWADRLAASGVRFDAAHAHNVTTLPSHANILSGRYPFDHGVRDNMSFRFPPGVETIATLLAARGYRTGAFVSGFPLASRFGLRRGFEVYDDAFVGALARPAFRLEERRGADTVALARRWLEAERGRPFFCWVHLYEPHYPYEPPEPYATRFRADPYHGEVAAADAALGPLLEPILASGKAGRTLVVLTADHGESLGEHGEATHGILAYEATLRVPLVLYQPRLFPPRVVPDLVRHVDLLPTILDALALPVPEGLPGTSLLPLVAGASSGPVTSYFEALAGQLDRGWAPLYGVLHDRTKYVDLPIVELYDLDRDPAEARNLAATRPRELEALRARLAPLRAADRGIEPQRESADVLDRLRSLGYVSAGPSPAKERYTEDDDPKRLIELDGLLREVRGLYLEGNVEAARALPRARATAAADGGLAALPRPHRHGGRKPAGGRLGARAGAGRQPETRRHSRCSRVPHAGRTGRRGRRPPLGARAAAGPTGGAAIARPRPGPARPREGGGRDAHSRARGRPTQNVQLLVDLGTVHLMAGETGPPGGVRGSLGPEPRRRAGPQLARVHGRAGRPCGARARAPEEGPLARPPRCQTRSRSRRSPSAGEARRGLAPTSSCSSSRLPARRARRASPGPAPCSRAVRRRESPGGGPPRIR